MEIEKHDMTEMDKNKENDKQVKISSDRHQELKLLSAKTGKEMREIINEAFDMYLMKYNIRDWYRMIAYIYMYDFLERWY